MMMLQRKSSIEVRSCFFFGKTHLFVTVAVIDRSVSFPFCLGSVSLNGSVSAAFFFGRDVQSKYVKVESSDSNHLAEMIQTAKALNDDILISVRDLEAIISFSTRLAAVDGIHMLNKKFSSDDNVDFIRPITIAEHCIVTCEWKLFGSTLERTTLKNLANDARALTGTFYR